jgi:hypothetical protein
VIYYIILLFAIFTLVKGASWVGLIKLHIGLMFYVVMNLVFGVILVVFYFIVLYTNVPIPKNDDHLEEYQGIGLCSGISFLVTVPCLLFFYWFIKGKKLQWRRFLKPMSLALLASIVLLFGIDITLFVKSNEMSKITTSIDTMAIALNAIPI